MRNAEINFNDLVTSGLVKLSEREYIRDISRSQVHAGGRSFWAEVEEWSDDEWKKIVGGKTDARMPLGLTEKPADAFLEGAR